MSWQQQLWHNPSSSESAHPNLCEYKHGIIEKLNQLTQLMVGSKYAFPLVNEILI